VYAQVTLTKTGLSAVRAFGHLGVKQGLSILTSVNYFNQGLIFVN
jgi:hypothetical protein